MDKLKEAVQSELEGSNESTNSSTLSISSENQQADKTSSENTPPQIDPEGKTEKSSENVENNKDEAFYTFDPKKFDVEKLPPELKEQGQAILNTHKEMQKAWTQKNQSKSEQIKQLQKVIETLKTSTNADTTQVAQDSHQKDGPPQLKEILEPIFKEFIAQDRATQAQQNEQETIQGMNRDIISFDERLSPENFAYDKILDRHLRAELDDALRAHIESGKTLNSFSHLDATKKIVSEYDKRYEQFALQKRNDHLNAERAKAGEVKKLFPQSGVSNGQQKAVSLRDAVRLELQNK